MLMLRNSVILLEINPHVSKGTYRILDYFTEDNVLVLFLLGQAISKKPFVMDLANFDYLVKGNYLTQLDHQPPHEFLLRDDQLSTSNKQVRDNNYSLIKELVEDPSFLKKFCSTVRSRVVIEHALNLAIEPTPIYRALYKYWEYGQVPNALLTFTSKFGGRGKEKSASLKQRGRPINQGFFHLRRRIGVNVTAADQIDFAEAIRAEAKERKTFAFARAYERYKEMFCSMEFELAVKESRPAQIPSYDQFLYWGQKLISKQELIRSQITESEYEKDHVGSLSSVNDKFVAPGMRYEIDSTVADVYVVCEIRRDRVLGRPTIYFVVDVASRMIVGIHVSLEYASWTAARQSLFNACMPKVDYCKRYGITIEHKDWPCVGVSATLMADRAEMLGENAFFHAKQVGTLLNIAPTARGDMKSIVERRFGIANEDIHFLPGTTLGQLKKRGEPDHRLEAAITLSALTKILIEAVLEHNNFRPFDDLTNRDLVQHDLGPTPKNYWNFYSARMQNSLKTFSENHFIALLMKPGEASVRDRGIIFRELRYTCQKAEDEDWATRALQNGSWKVECRHDDSWSTDIYIKEPHGNEFIKCRLLSADRTYADLPEIEVAYIKEWNKAKSEDPEYDNNKIQRSRRVDDVVKEEVKLTKAAAVNQSKRAKVADIRANRKEHLESKNRRFRNQIIRSLSQWLIA